MIATDIKAIRNHSSQDGNGSIKNPTPKFCIRVLAFPPLLAGITPPRITNNLKMVIPISRARITIVIHHGNLFKIESEIIAEPIKTLSATGSRKAPSGVMRLELRAHFPSTISVMPRTKKMHQARIWKRGLSPPSKNKV